jgi:hypothetical protein
MGKRWGQVRRSPFQTRWSRTLRPTEWEDNYTNNWIIKEEWLTLCNHCVFSFRIINHMVLDHLHWSSVYTLPALRAEQVQFSYIYFLPDSLFNPFSHCLFCVSRLTAICHMRHPYKADLGKKWRRFWCLCVCPSAKTPPTKWFKTEQRRQIFTFFAITSPVGLQFEFWKNWLNPQSMLIPNLFHLFWIFASKGFKSR